eukprot:381878-Amphidinium_carterae.1
MSGRTGSCIRTATLLWMAIYVKTIATAGFGLDVLVVRVAIDLEDGGYDGDLFSLTKVLNLFAFTPVGFTRLVCDEDKDLAVGL